MKRQVWLRLPTSTLRRVTVLQCSPGPIQSLYGDFIWMRHHVRFPMLSAALLPSVVVEIISKHQFCEAAQKLTTILARWHWSTHSNYKESTQNPNGCSSVQGWKRILARGGFAPSPGRLIISPRCQKPNTRVPTRSLIQYSTGSSCASAYRIEHP